MDEDEIFGFRSRLNLTERKGTQRAEQIKELIKSFCETCEKSMTEQLDKLLNDTTKPVGFQLSERFINGPPQIVLPMHTSATSVRNHGKCLNSSFFPSEFRNVILI